ncbi:STAS domain-containing protein [Streptomyces candidus]|uniref:Anti-sigma factor antagonist n=1 Tax=Streptomyces candidus TaxID=67283 RepID=A0A7X0HKJ2_9ACTN|nr:STAS domain-containing protein [Streptomyces candidus]MBB6439359.1 anti-anti-sigma factor [Streptomyces candidus]GHH44169.1 anti-sigma factor antagonist [Streptomyces candidus]
MSALKITSRDAATGPVVEIAGDLDYDTAGRLREVCTDLALHSGQRLVIDLAALEFMDSTGITALIAARNHALAAGADIALAAVPDNTIRILRLVGLDQIFPMHPSTEAATVGAG